MKASIVIPAHNEKLSLAATISAALNQDYHDYEVIVVDNASTDMTYEIARSFKGNASGSPTINVVQEPRKGLLWARECGRRAATGQIIANIDADCLPHKNWLAQGVGHLERTGAAAVTGPYDYYDGDLMFRKFSLLSQRFGYRFMNALLQIRLLRMGAIMIGGNNLIRADVLERMGGYNTSILFYGEDVDTAKRVARYGRVLFAPDFTIKTSARRFKSEGTLNISSKYFLYFLKTVFSH